MKTELRVYSGDTLLGTVELTWIKTIDERPTYSIQQGDLPQMLQPDPTTTRRRRRNRKLLDTIADPERGFPILRSLIQKFAPILIEYLMKQLPIWLADVEDLNHDEPIA